MSRTPYVLDLTALRRALEPLVRLGRRMQARDLGRVGLSSSYAPRLGPGTDVHVPDRPVGSALS